MVSYQHTCMRLRRTGTRRQRGRGARSRPINSVLNSFSIESKPSLAIVKETMVLSEEASALNEQSKGIVSDDANITSMKEEHLPSFNLNSSSILEEKNTKFSKGDQGKITNYFTPRISTTNGSAVLASSDHLMNGSCTNEDLRQAKTAKSRANHKDSLSSPTKENKKLANGCVDTEIMKPNVCTRSQSQKLLSPMKDAKEITIDNIKDSKKVLELSPVKTEVPLTPKDADMSPQTGPPTPHKIQALNEDKLRLDTPLSTSKAFSKLKLLSPQTLSFANKTSKNKRNIAPPAPSKGSDKKPVLTNGALNATTKPTMRNTQMTEFFPIRRSHRKPKTTIIQEKQKMIEERIIRGDEEGLRVQDFGLKGRGIVTTRLFSKGEMVVEYVGDLIDTKEAKEREKKYALDSSKGCYMYYFTFQNTQYCIDATEESGYLGRLVNHSRNGNLATKTVLVKGKPHLVLIAKKDIDEGVEVLYDYGDRSKQALEHHPWLAL